MVSYWNRSRRILVEDLLETLIFDVRPKLYGRFLGILFHLFGKLLRDVMQSSVRHTDICERGVSREFTVSEHISSE